MRHRGFLLVAFLSAAFAVPGRAPAECNGGPAPPVDPKPSTEEPTPPPPPPSPSPPRAGAPTGSGAGPGSGVRGGTATAGGGPGSNMSMWGLESWEDWWSVHSDRYLALRRRSRLADGRVATLPDGNGDGGAGNAVAATGARQFLLGALRDPSWDVRAAAAIALGRSGTEAALPGLLRTLGERRREVRGSCAVGSGLLRDPIAAQELGAVIFDPAEPEHLRGIVAISLGLLRGPEASRVLLDYVDPASDARRAGGIGRTQVLEETAVAALGMAGDVAAAPALRKILAAGNREDRTRAFAAVALARLGDRASLPLLLQALRADPDLLRQAGAVALGVLATSADRDEVAALVRAAKEDRDATTRRFAILGLGRISGEAAREALADQFGRGRAPDQPYAVLALGVAGATEVGPALAETFRTARDPEVRGACALALGLLGHRAAAADLLAAARAPGDHDFRGHCFEALGLLGHLPAGEVARALLADDHPDEELLAPAAACLALLGDRRSLRSLPRLLAGGHHHGHRRQGYRVLGLVGDDAMLPELVAAARDRARPEEVRVCTVEAIGALLEPRETPALSEVAMDSQFLMFQGPLRAVMGHR